MLFLDIKRPLRPPMNWINTAVIRAVAMSPFAKAARAQHVAREEQFTAAWNAVLGRLPPTDSVIDPPGTPADPAGR